MTPPRRKKMIEVALPLDAINKASAREKSINPELVRAMAPSTVVKIPNWAAAPRNRVLGLASSGPKSVMAPTPMKITSGKIPGAIPAS